MGDLGMLDPGGQSLGPRDELKTQFMTREGRFEQFRPPSSNVSL